MAKKKFEQELEHLDSLRGGAPAAVEGLRRALGNRNNYLVAKAAKIVGQDGLTVLIPDLVAAFERFFDDPVKTDPQCWAKNAIAKALADLGHDDPDTYLRGLRHTQMEGVWGGREDTAAALRAQCAVALVDCRSIRDLTLLSHLIDLLYDHEKTVRVEVARAIGRVEREEAALLLRVRAMAGDEEPEVIGACLTAVLAIEGARGIEFVDRFLDHGNEVAGEAALALATLRDSRVLPLIENRWKRERDPDLAAVLLAAIALTRLPEAIDFLVEVCEKGPATASTAALDALASLRVPDDVRQRIEVAVQRSGSPAVLAAYQKHFRAS